MQLQSLGYRTDLIFAGFDGEIIDRGSHLVVRSPTNPTFYWGNFLIFPSPPNVGDDKRWRQLFMEEIGEPPSVKHQAFGWDSPSGDGIVQPFLDDGFHLVRNIVLKSAAPRQPKRVADFVDIRSLESDQDWEQAIDNQVLCREEGHDEASFRVFTERQMRRYREMSAAGKGDWFGAFVGDRLVADLGLFTDGTLGRYQSVETHPDFRRRGIAGTLVYKVGEHMMDKHGIGTLVIVAENDSDAARLYRTTGFEPVEPQWGLEWWESRE